MSDETTALLLQRSQQLLDCISEGDWPTYEGLCDTDLTAFEPEARGQRVTGLGFHRYYFDLEQAPGTRQTTMVDPQVRLLGENAALVTYIRLVQCMSTNGPMTTRCEETRIWEKRDGTWVHTHFHRSDNSGTP